MNYCEITFFLLVTFFATLSDTEIVRAISFIWCQSGITSLSFYFVFKFLFCVHITFSVYLFHIYYVFVFLHTSFS